MTAPDFRHAFHANKDVLYRFVYRMTGSANGAEDIVQECFLALWRKPDAYDANRGALRAFLLGIARNLVLKRWRDDHPHDASIGLYAWWNRSSDDGANRAWFSADSVGREGDPRRSLPSRRAGSQPEAILCIRRARRTKERLSGISGSH
jgi:RNA polymerase sigma factor (sigma-70 family)